jgi:hypothetical protein
MPIEIDFEGVSNEGFPLLDEGLYEATITAIKPGLSQAKKPKLEVTFTLKDMNGRLMWANYSLQKDSLWKLKQDLVSLGYDVPEGKFDVPVEEMMGMAVQLQIIHKPHWEDASKMVEEIAKMTRSDGVDW